MPIRMPAALFRNKANGHMHCEEQWLEAVGNTVRHGRSPPRGVQAALVVADTITCHFWLNILPLVKEASIRHFLTVADLEAISDRLHVRPSVVPSFIVFRGGYMVDWFPAPLPRAGLAANPHSLVDVVKKRLLRYEDHP